MADVTLTYKGDTIAELSESGSKTIETAGKYCEADILLEYVKPEGGDAVIDLSDPALWERKDFSSTSAVGTSYDGTRTDTTTRITLKEPLEYKEAVVSHKDVSSYDIYCLFYDEQKKYIGWSFNGWESAQQNYITTVQKRQVTGNSQFSNAKYFGIALRKNNNSTITTNDATTANLNILSGDFSQ